MALLPLQIQSIYFTNKPHFYLHKPHFYPPVNPKFTIISQNLPDDPITDKKATQSSGQGFGPAQLSKPKPESPSSSSGKNKGKRERESIIRRSPVNKPAFLDKKGVVEEQSNTETSLNESAFLLTWLGLGSLILVEGLALSASGFLPEKWDKFFVKFVYPAFTPTVFLFVAGTVTYGVIKYFQNENARNQN